MFQAKLRGWRRLAAGLVLVPGLTGVGAEALGLVGRATGQERPAANRADEARELMRRAREAYDAQNYGLAQELAAKARALKAPPAFYDDQAEEPAADVPRKPAGRTVAPPAAAATSRPSSADPKVLTVLAKQALEVGELDKAQDLATQAQASAATVKWGLFEDTPASLLKDVSKARGRRDKDVAERLMVEARTLLDRPVATKTERVANLTAAEEKARQAANLNATYSMWDFGDRPADLIADARKAREKEKLVAARNEPQGDDPAPKGSAYGARKPVLSDDAPPPTSPMPPARTADATRKKAAIALMQEAKSLEVGRHYVDARKKYAEAARLNAAFGRDEDSPEAELTRLNLAAQRRINGLVDEARSCTDRRDTTAARGHLDEAHALCTGMGLDASVVVELKAGLKPVGATTSRATKPTDEDTTPPIIRTGAKSESVGDELPAPIIRNGRKPMTDEPTGLKTVGGEEPPIGPIPTPKALPMAEAIQPIPTSKAKPTTVDPDLPPPLPTVPDTDNQAEVIKPPMVVKTPAKPEVSDKGRELLRAARAELNKGETENARKIAIELINGSYGVKDEALTLLSSIETKEAGRKMDDAHRAFGRAQEAYVAGNYPQALAIFKQIDGMLLTATDRKVMTDMMAAAQAEQKKVASTGPDGLPRAPKPAAGVQELPPTGPAPAPRTGADNLVKQQEALTQVEFQRLRSKALRVESEATARFGKGETDAALMDLQNFVTEVKASKLEPSKQNLLCRPVEARMDRLRILKHQTDFLTKEARDRRNFKSEMTQEALAKIEKQKEVAGLTKAAAKLMDEAKYREAYVKLQMAQSIQPDDATISHSAIMAQRLMRLAEHKKAEQGQEQWNYDQMNGLNQFPQVNDKDPLRWTDDKETRDRMFSRGKGGINVHRTKSESEKVIERKMSTPLSVNFKATPLDSVVDQLHLMTSINFDLDYRRLKEENVDPKLPITIDLSNVSLKSALDIICRQAGLRHAIESEAIRVSTSKGLAGRQMVKSIPVGDLVIPTPNYGAHPGLSLMESLKAAQDAAYGVKPSGSPRTPAGSLPGGAGTGVESSMSNMPGSANKIRSSAPRDGGSGSNMGPANGGTLERELIRLICNTIKPDSWNNLGGEGSIEYFPIGLALVINQSPEVIEEVERLLESLRKLQDLEVSIEVKVVSLAETFFERIGVDFSMGIPTNASPQGGPATGVTIPGITPRNIQGNVVGLQIPGVATPDLDIPIRATSFNRAIPPFGGFNNSFADGGISLGLAFLSDIQVQMFLEAAQGDTRTNVMQAPKLTALNGTAASMTVGDFQFFLTGITVTTVAGQLVFTPQNVPFAVGITQPIPPNASIQNGLLNFSPTQPQTPGLGLFIQPVVSADRRFVRLNIQQSFTNLISGTQQIPITTIITPVFENGGSGQPVPFTQFLQQPRFSNLETQTVVVVPDGGTVVMGGLKYMTEGRNEFGPPVLGKIPYLNRLFRNVAYGREGRSILIMVTPRVIINREEQERQTGVRDDDFVGLVGPG